MAASLGKDSSEVNLIPITDISCRVTTFRLWLNQKGAIDNLSVYKRSTDTNYSIPDSRIKKDISEYRVWQVYLTVSPNVFDLVVLWHPQRSDSVRYLIREIELNTCNVYLFIFTVHWYAIILARFDLGEIWSVKRDLRHRSNLIGRDNGFLVA